MDTLRYWLGVLLVVMLPAAMPYWYMIHGWPALWRRLGKWATITIQFSLMALMMWGLWRARATLIGRPLDLWWLPLIPGLVLYGMSVRIALERKKYLTFGPLMGLPEFAPSDHPPKLFQEGIYGRIRHPRYLELILGVAGWALVVHYTGVYWVTAASILALLLIIPLEERELLQRFGDAYAEYRSRVPALVPRRDASNPDTPSPS